MFSEKLKTDGLLYKRISVLVSISISSESSAYRFSVVVDSRIKRFRFDGKVLQEDGVVFTLCEQLVLVRLRQVVTVL